MEERAPGRGQLVEVHAVEPPAQAAADLLDQHRLEHRSHRDAVVGAQQVEGAPHHQRAHRASALEQLDELRRPEVLQPRPQPGVRLERLLGLQPHEVRDRLGGGCRAAFGQPLAVEGGPVEGAPVERLHGVNLVPGDSVVGMAELHDLTALEQGELIRKGELSPPELTEHYLDRVDRLDDVGAFVTATSERARERAAALPVRDGPLWGVPTAIKDLNLTAGVPTMFGSEAFRDFVPDVSDGVTLSIEAAGMVSLGKTNTPEFGSPCYTEPDVAPPAVTPWDRTRMAGGSSGGAAAAVAAGLVPVAHGSDGGGSIRIPASCCGLVGLKPTRWRISGFPMYGDPVGLATGGSLARNVRDAAALLDVLAGRRPGDPAWAPPPGGTFLAACDRDPGTLQIARFVAPVITDVLW